MNYATWVELSSLLSGAAATHEVCAVIVTGAGDKWFVGGGDVAEVTAQTPISGRELARTGQQIFDEIERLGKPVIAAVNGFALGRGCELAMACTFRFAGNTARFGQPETNLGLIPSYAGTQRLPRLIGRGRALELLLTAVVIGAEEAWRIGLVNCVVPAANLMNKARIEALALADKPAIAVRYIIGAVVSRLDMPFREAEIHEATRSFSSPRLTTCAKARWPFLANGSRISWGA